MVDSPCVPSRPPFFIGVILRLSFLKVRFLAKPIDASIMGLLAYEIVPFRAELFPPDGSLFLLQGGQAVAVFEFVLPA